MKRVKALDITFEVTKVVKCDVFHRDCGTCSVREICDVIVLPAPR
jgi:hypothetical protein